MKIRHERPMSDLSFQVRAPLGLELATGDRVTIGNWSLQGFEFPGDSDVLPKEATLSIPFQGVDIRFPVRLTHEGTGRFLAFDGLSGRQRETLAVFYRSILSGKMASTEEVITSLDTPVDLVPMEETDAEKSAATAGKTPRPLRAVFSVLLYLSLAAAVFWTLGSGIYGKLSSVSIENARIEAPFIAHSAGPGGLVDAVRVAPGDVVQAGDVLVEITTSDGEAALDSVRARIQALERRQNEAADRAAGLGARVARERAILLEAISQEPRAAEARQRQMLEDFDRGLSTEHADLIRAHRDAARNMAALNLAALWDAAIRREDTGPTAGDPALAEAERRLRGLEGQVTAARAALVDAIRTVPAQIAEAARARLADFDNGLSLPHADLLDAHRAALREADAVENELRLLRRERGRLGAALAALDIVALEDGIVRDVYVADGQHVRPGVDVAIVEGTQSRHARGWLDQGMAASVHVGMEVAVTLNTGRGRERLRGEVIDLEAGIDPALSPAFGMLVTIAFPQLTAEESRTALPHRMPVELTAQRGWAARFEAWIARAIPGVEG